MSDAVSSAVVTGVQLYELIQNYNIIPEQIILPSTRKQYKEIFQTLHNHLINNNYYTTKQSLSKQPREQRSSAKQC